MKMKDFFRSNAFKSLAVLMIIVIVCGGVIAVFNSLLYVPEEEATRRAVAKIFGKTPESMITLILSDAEKKNSHGLVDQAYYIEDIGNKCLFIHSTGGSGFSGGTVSVWTVISVTGAVISDGKEYVSAAVTGISSVRYESDTGQTLMGNFKETYYAQFTRHNDDVARGIYFTASSVRSQTVSTEGTVVSPPGGASMSAVAIVNAVNAALCFALGGEK